MRYRPSLLIMTSLLACEASPTTPGEAADLEVEDRRARAEEFCERAKECDGLDLLFSREECTLQAHQKLERLFEKSLSTDDSQAARTGIFDAPRCQHCITALTCSGMTEVASGLITLGQLCPNCAGRLKNSSPPEACLLSGVIKKRAEPPELEKKTVEVPDESAAAIPEKNATP